MCSFSLAVDKKPLPAGILLGIAAGFRITALGMALPLAILFISQDSPKTTIKRLITFWGAAACLAVTAYIPPFVTYGPGFFMYYQYFPDPPMLKNIYKATIGAWGLMGWLAVIVALVASIRSYINTKPSPFNQRLLMICSIVMAMYLYAYYKLPQKSAFVIPAAPFVIMAVAMLLRKNQLRYFAGAMVFSSLFLGVNLDDPNSGSNRSALSFGFTAAGSSAAIDVLYGPVVADLTKRKNKIEYAAKVSDAILATNKKTLLIAGWYQNEIEYYLIGKSRENLITAYYSDQQELQSYRDKGYVILHLPEQDLYNDLRYAGSFTSGFSSPFSEESD
jgi:hypothetical protein